MKSKHFCILRLQIHVVADVAIYYQMKKSKLINILSTVTNNQLFIVLQAKNTQ